MVLLLRKILNIKKDYIETISGNNSPDEDKLNLNKFLDKIKSSKGKVKSINLANCSDTKSVYSEKYDGEYKKRNPYSTGWLDDTSIYTEFFHHFVIHYKCYKKLEHENEISPIGEFKFKIPNNF